MSPENSTNMQVEARIERLNVHSRAYTAGWIVKKCLNVFNCPECKRNLTQNSEPSMHKCITCKEYEDFNNKYKLTYPAEYVVRYFSYIVKETNQYLESKPNSGKISRQIFNLIKTKYSFNILTCPYLKDACSI